MPPIPPTPFYAPGHVAQRLNESISDHRALSSLSKGQHTAVARVKPIEGIGLELRYEWNNELRASQVFRTWEELEAEATSKRQELEGRGWQAG